MLFWVMNPHQRCLQAKVDKSNTECGIMRPTNAIYMGSYSLLGSKLPGVLK